MSHTNQTIEFVISTCNDRINNVGKIFLPVQDGVRYIVVYQHFNASTVPELKFDWCERDDVKVLLSRDKGVAKSRNLGLSHATADILYLLDDDIFLDKKVVETVRNTFSNFTADIVTFIANTPSNKPFKKYSSSAFKHNALTVLKISTIEVAFLRKSALRIDLKCDEQFGLGATFSSSEENLFLLDALKRGLKICYVPEVTVYHPPMSSGKDWSNQSLLYSKAAFFYRGFGFWGIPLYLVFAIKKWPEYRDSWSLIEFLRIGFKGLSDYKRGIS